MSKNTSKASKAEDYITNASKSSFLKLFFDTQKYDQFVGTEGLISMILAVCSTAICSYLYQNYNTQFVDMVNEISLNIIVSLIGMLGFIIGGLAILTGSITSNIIKNIDEDNRFKPLFSTLFSFYFVGVMIGITIFIFFLIYFISKLPLEGTNISTVCISFIASYFFCFSIIYSIALLGTCLRILLVGYKYSGGNKK